MKDLTFNISETSQITGLSIDTLRYYDKIGLIQSKKNPNNRYRYYTIADELSKEDGKTIEQILQDTINILYKNTYLKENEIEEFKKLILSLGKSEVESQERLIDLTVENLKKLTIESKEDIKNKGNLYKKLITFSGICIGIILI